MKKRLTGFKILVVILIVFGVGILLIMNSFWGNPLSAAIAASKIEEYVEMNYPDINVQIEPASYSFKDGGFYYALVQATNSIDTVFSVRWYGDRIDDNYQNVSNLATTFNRLSDELDGSVEKIIAQQFPYETRLVGCAFKDVPVQLQEERLVLDMPLDIENPPFPMKLIVWCSAERPDYEVLAERMLELRDIMNRNKIPVEYYSLSVEYPYIMEEGSLKPIQWDDVSVHDFPAHQLNESNLPAVLEEYFIQWEKVHEK